MIIHNTITFKLVEFDHPLRPVEHISNHSSLYCVVPNLFLALYVSLRSCSYLCLCSYWMVYHITKFVVSITKIQSELVQYLDEDPIQT